MTLRRLWAALALVALTTACGSPSKTSDTPRDPQLVEVGADLYAANCAQCHGDDLRGTEEGPSFLSEVYEPGHHADGAFLLAVTRGVQPHHWQFGPMPPVEGLTTEDVEAIVPSSGTANRPRRRVEQVTGLPFAFELAVA